MDDYYARCPECLQRAVLPFDDVQIGYCSNCEARLVYCDVCHGDGIQDADLLPAYWQDCEYCQGTGLQKLWGDATE